MEHLNRKSDAYRLLVSASMYLMRQNRLRGECEELLDNLRYGLITDAPMIKLATINSAWEKAEKHWTGERLSRALPAAEAPAQ